MSSLSPIGIPFIELPTVDSTNNYAMGLLREAMAQHGTAVFAHDQIKGKGQRNRQWTSEKNQNIALSLLIEPKRLNNPPLFQLSKTIALAVYKFIDHYTLGEVRIKWPNDIYWRDRKAAGILIENLWQGSEWKFAVVGIGVNINQQYFGELNSKAVSLKQITGKDFQPILLAQDLCGFVEKELDVLLKYPLTIDDAYRNNLYKLDQSVKLKKANRIFEAVVKDVNANGQLVVEHGIEEKFDVGEVEWIVS